MLKLATPPWACCHGTRGINKEDEEVGLPGVVHIMEPGEDSGPAASPLRVGKAGSKDPVKNVLNSSGHLLSAHMTTPGQTIAGLATPIMPYGMSFRQQSVDALPTLPEGRTPSSNSRDPYPSIPVGAGNDALAPPTEAEVEEKGKKLMRLASDQDNMEDISESQMINIHNPGKLRESYDLGVLIGSGSFGTVVKASVKATGAIRAIKSILKEGSAGWRQCLDKEIRIFKMVDHPNIVKLYEVFEDKDKIHLVLEFCAGGELYDKIGSNGIPEGEAATVMLQLLRGVLYLHKKFIVHRDLKAQNLLVTSKGRGESAYEHSLRITDFGLSCTFKPNQVLNAKVGTYTHMSPQVFNKKYTKACDLWSCGVILYHMLSGVLPFTGMSDDEVMQKVKRGRVMFSGGWADRSSDSVEVAQMLMHYTEDKRYTSEKALDSKWIVTTLSKKHSARLDYAILQNLRGFRKLNKLKKAILSVVASMLTEPQIRPARLAFMMLDKDGDGAVSVTELRSKLLEEKERKRQRLAEEKRKAEEAENGGGGGTLEGGTPRSTATQEVESITPRTPGKGLRRNNSFNAAGAAEKGRKTGRKNTTTTIPDEDASPASRKAGSRTPKSRKSTDTTPAESMEEDEESIQRNPNRNKTVSAFIGNDMDAALKDIFDDVSNQPTNSGSMKKMLTLDAFGEGDSTMPDFPYTEFLAATFDRDRYINDNVCRAAFRVMDKDQDGKLSLSDIRSGALLGRIAMEEYQQILDEVDTDGDGYIDIDEFKSMLKSKDGWAKCFNLNASTLFPGA